MIVGVKYCGGCNPRYDRVEAVKALAVRFPMHEFLPAAQVSSLDVLLVMSGCSVGCADVSGFAPGLATIWVSDSEDLSEAESAIAQIEKGSESDELER